MGSLIWITDFIRNQIIKKIHKVTPLIDKLKNRYAEQKGNILRLVLISLHFLSLGIGNTRHDVKAYWSNVWIIKWYYGISIMVFEALKNVKYVWLLVNGKLFCRCSGFQFRRLRIHVYYNGLSQIKSFVMMIELQYIIREICFKQVLFIAKPYQNSFTCDKISLHNVELSDNNIFNFKDNSILFKVLIYVHIKK